MVPRLFLAGFLLGCSGAVSAQPLSQSQKVDFFRDVPSRSLQGLATRSDGRLTAGPVLRELNGSPGADLLWSLSPGAGDRWLVGSGPDGRILEVTLAGDALESREWGRVDDSHVFVVRRLADGSVLAGSSPRGGLHLLREGEVVASVRLPADSVFDLLEQDDGSVLVGTGNPGRIFRVDLATFAQAGQPTETLQTGPALAAAGIQAFGQIRDRNVRRLARTPEGHVLAGSAPSGNLYRFTGAGEPPQILLDHDRAEVTDLRVESNGDIFALVVFSSTPGSPTRMLRPVPVPEPGAGADSAPVPLPMPDDGSAPVENFAGRSALLWIPGGNGFAETLASRANVALYRMAPRGDLMILSGGDAGELLGFDRRHRRSLTFGGSTSAQLSDLQPLGQDRFLVLRNNPAGLAVLDFAAPGPRHAETRRLDLRSASRLGALRFSRLRAVEPSEVTVSLRANRADDELEGWTPWTPAEEQEGGWIAPELRGRFVQVRVELPADVDPAAELDAAQLHHLPQNRRPVLQGFRIISPNFGLLPRPDSGSSGLLTLGQVIEGENDRGGGGRESPSQAMLSSQLVPQPGAQVVYWTLDDPDGDQLAVTFSIRRDGTDQWVDLVVDTSEPWLQFDRTHLADGVYFTRLTARELAPRAPDERLEVSFEADDLVIDQTPPEISTALVERVDGQLRLTVGGRDALSLLAGIEVRFNNGHQLAVEQPADGILDSVAETFRAEVPLPEAAGATSAEVLLYDAFGNSSSRRVRLETAAP